MLNRLTTVVALNVVFLGATAPTLACGPSPEKGWLEFIDQARGFCFWYPPTYKREAGTKVDWHDRQSVAKLVSSEARNAGPNEKQPASVEIYLLAGVFDLNRLIAYAPTGYVTPPIPKHFGQNVFYYYGPGGGGVAYPDMYHFNLGGRALQMVFDGPYNNDKSPDAKTKAFEKVILGSFKAIESSLGTTRSVFPR